MSHLFSPTSRPPGASPGRARSTTRRSKGQRVNADSRFDAYTAQTGSTKLTPAHQDDEEHDEQPRDRS